MPVWSARGRYVPAVAPDDACRILRPVPRTRPGHRWQAIVGVVALVLVGCGRTDAAHRSAATTSTRRDTLAAPSSVGTPDTTATTALPTTAPPAAPPTTSAGSGVRVVAVIDGDTIDVAGGERVRLIGIDTPEVGQCGYDGATAVLRQLVGGRDVVLVPGARDDRDRYGRLLRYVEANGVDVNLMMLLSGRAIARYDSRDGYGRHPREDAYVAADVANPSANVCGPGGPASTVPATTAAPGATGADPRFGSCREAIANGYGPYARGVDPEFGWYHDGDGDGVACE